MELVHMAAGAFIIGAAGLVYFAATKPKCVALPRRAMYVTATMCAILAVTFAYSA